MSCLWKHSKVSVHKRKVGEKIKIVIRDAKKSDLDKVSEMSCELAKYESKFNKNIKTEERLRQTKNWYLRKFDKIKISLAEKEGRTIGYATAWIEKKDKRFYKNDEGYFCDLFIMPEDRRTGIGKKLYKEIIKWLKLKNIKVVTLSVYDKNPATNFWKSIGFKPTCTNLTKRI